MELNAANDSCEESNKNKDILLINLFLQEFIKAKEKNTIISEEEVFNKTINKYGLFCIEHSENILCMLKNYNSDINLLKCVLGEKERK